MKEPRLSKENDCETERNRKDKKMKKGTKRSFTAAEENADIHSNKQDEKQEINSKKKKKKPSGLKEEKNPEAKSPDTLSKKKSKMVVESEEMDVTAEVRQTGGAEFGRPIEKKKDINFKLMVFSVLMEQKERDVVQEYFEAGGSASEILAAMSNVSKASPSHALAALKILECLFLRTLRDFPLKQVDCEETAIKLLQSAAPFLNSLLAPTSWAHDTGYKIKIALKLLTAIVSLSARAASEVLFYITLDKEVVQQLTKPPGTARVHSRVHFLHFLLSFLVDGNAHTIKLLLSKKGVLGTALLGLVHDSAPLVHLVLTTLRTKILENPGLTKFHKQKAFNTHVLESLVLLYDWQGPTTVRRNKKRRHVETKTVVDPEDLKLVREGIHSFLTLLLTSHKWGIIYTNKVSSSAAISHNLHAFTVLRRMLKPWQDELQGELVISALQACPTLLRLTLSLYREALAPRPTHVWLDALAYTIKVLDHMSFPDVLQTQKDDNTFEAKDLARLAEEISLPFSLLKEVLKSGLSHSHAAVREGCARLLTCVFDNLSKHVQYVTDHRLLTSAGVNTMRQLISAQLAKVAPGIKLVWSTWELAIKVPNINKPSVPMETATQKTKNEKGKAKESEESSSSSSSDSDDSSSSEEEEEEEPKIKKIKSRNLIPMDLYAPEDVLSQVIPDGIEEPDRSIQLSSLLSLLLGYQNWLPHWLEGSSHLARGAGLLCDIKDTTKVIAAEKGEETATKLQLQSICLLSSFDSLAISPSQELFPWALGLLIKEARSTLYARTSLEKLLGRLELLQENPHELDVWFWSSLEQGDEATLSLMICALVRLARDPVSYAERQYEAIIFAQNLDHVTSATQQLDEMLEELEKEVQNESEESSENNIVVPKSDSAFSPLLLAALDEIIELKSNSKPTSKVQQYVGSVLVRLLLQQTHPGPLAHIEQSTEEYVCEESDSKQWIDVAHSVCHLRQLFHISTFYVAQATTADTLNEEKMNRCKEVMQFVLSNGTPELAKECLNSALRHPILLNAFSLQAKQSSARLATSLLLYLVGEAHALKDRQSVMGVRQKTLQQLTSCFTKGMGKYKFLSWLPPDTLMQLMTNLLLDKRELAQLLDAVCQLPASTCIKDKLIIPDSLTEFVLQRLVDLRKESQCDKKYKSFALHTNYIYPVIDKICDAKDIKEDIDMSLIENALACYLEAYPHHEIPEEMLLQMCIKSSQRLSQVLVSRTPTLLPLLHSMVSTTDPVTILPVIWTAQQRFPEKISSEMLRKLWTKLQADILQAVKKSSKAPEWFLANSECVIFLLHNYLDSETANKVVSYLQNHEIFSSCEAHALMLDQVWEKAENSKECHILWLFQSVIKALSDPSESGLTSLLCKQLCSNLNNHPPLKNFGDFIVFCKLMLRSGVGNNVQLLETLTEALAVVSCQSELSDIWEMLLSHSQFLPTLLGSKSEQKFGVLKVMVCLTRQKPSLMNAKHVPLLLGAYRASLSAADQLILKLLQHYEANGINFNELKPLVWGSAAVSRYALSQQSHSRLALWNQPSPNQVLQLLEQKRVDATIIRFPLDRGLEDETESAPDSEVYDPAFLLPLLAQLLAPEMPVQAWRVTRQALGMCLMALTSSKESTRSAGQLLIARLYFHLEAGRATNENKSMLRFLNMLRQSLYSKEEKKMKLLPPLLGLFLAKAIQVISHPKNPLYMKLNQFLMARQVIELDGVPELLRLLHDLEPEHRAHQIWILEVLRDGMRTKADFSVFCNSFTFKLLACLYKSSLSNTEIKVLILQVLTKVVQIPDAAWRLCSSNGLLSWLRGAVLSLPATVDDAPSEHIVTLLQFVENLWQAATSHNDMKNKDSGGFINQVAPSLMSTLLLLAPKVRAATETLLLLTTVISAICQTCSSVGTLLSKSHLKLLLQKGHQAGVSNLVACEDLLAFGCSYAHKCSGSDDKIHQKLRDIIFLVSPST
ncbi:hypothetical protein B566_EDAN004044 [Ephemera danica]|nr:hypothetical protein B566_EDAN004044 [Ephemera danica]